MTDKRKVKVIKSDYQIDNYDDYYSQSVLYPVGGDWTEVTQKEYQEISEALHWANQKRHQYILVEYDDNTVDEMFKDALDFKDTIKKRKEKEQRAKEIAAEKKAKAAKERKRKQLEKLKAEFGED